MNKINYLLEESSSFILLLLSRLSGWLSCISCLVFCCICWFFCGLDPLLCLLLHQFKIKINFSQLKLNDNKIWENYFQTWAWPWDWPALNFCCMLDIFSGRKKKKEITTVWEFSLFCFVMQLTVQVILVLLYFLY